MKICIVGCGAVGSLFAAHLAKTGEVEVWAYDVWREHTEAIRTQGLRLSGATEFTAPLHATSDPKELPHCDYGIVATKAIHTRNAIAQTAHAFADNSAVCSVQNGVGNEEILAEHGLSIAHVARHHDHFFGSEGTRQSIDAGELVKKCSIL